MKKYYIILAFAIMVSIHLLWDSFNGGIPVHHIHADENFPGMSNWWGLLSIPLISWLLLTIIEKTNKSDTNQSAYNPKVKSGFIIALSFGLLNSILWIMGMENILQYLIFLPVLLSLFMKVYKPEYILGFVIGMMITFGGVLPIFFSIILVVLSFLTYQVFNRGFYYFKAKVSK